MTSTLTKRQLKMLKRRHTIVSTLVEMLRARDFTYFTKETLYAVVGWEFMQSGRQGQQFNSLESGIFEAFTIIKLLRKFYSIDPSSNSSYEQVLSRRMQELKHLLPSDIPVPVEPPQARPRNQSKTSLSNRSGSHKRLQTLKAADYMRPYTAAILEDPLVKRRPGFRPKVIPPEYFETVERHRASLLKQRPLSSVKNPRRSLPGKQEGPRPASQKPMKPGEHRTVLRALKALHIPVQPPSAKKRWDQPQSSRRSNDLEKYVKIYGMAKAAVDLNT